MQTIKIKTWSCSECGYKQDFEPTAENMAIHFIPPVFPPIGEGECPACATGKNRTKILKKGVMMKKETDNNKKSVMNITEHNDEAEFPVLDAEGKEKKDADGKIIREIRKVKKGEYKTALEIQVLKDKYEDKEKIFV